MPPIDESLNAASDRKYQGKYTRDKGVQQMKYEKREVPLIEESLKAASDRKHTRDEGVPLIEGSLKAARNSKFTRDEGVQQMRYKKREVPLIDESL